MQIFLVTFRCFCFILEWEIHRGVQEKVIIKKHPMVIGVTLDIPVHPWSSGLISPIFLPCFATSTVADIPWLKTLSCWTQETSLELSLLGTVAPEEAKMEMRSRFRSMLKKMAIFPKFLCPDESIWANCSLQSVPMEQGVPRDSSLEGAKAAAVQGKGHSMSPSSRSRRPHIAPQVTTRHCQPCPS